MSAPARRPFVIVFAATDPTGGAGVFADCRALAARGCQPLAIVCAVTAQNLNGATAALALPPALARAQCAAIDSAGAAAIKAGVLGRAAGVCANFARRHNAPLVWDPVAAPTAGAPFASTAQMRAAARLLLPVAHTLTPNRRELLQLANEPTPTAAAAKLLKRGARYVLATDIDGESSRRARLVLFGGGARAARLMTPLWEASVARRAGVYHGSGCLFSSLYAAELAHKQKPPAAAAAALRGVMQKIKTARAVPQLGKQLLL